MATEKMATDSTIITPNSRLKLAFDTKGKPNPTLDIVGVFTKEFKTRKINTESRKV